MSAFLDERLSQEAGQRVETHVRNCDDCAELSSSTRQIRTSLRSLPRRTPPAALTTKLRVVASHELMRKARTETWSGWMHATVDNMRLWSQNAMRPFAIPTAGGFFSAAILFGLLSPIFSMPLISAADDVPTGLYTTASVKTSVPMSIVDDDLVVELTIDEQGRMTDYTIPASQNSTNSRAVRRAVENNLLFTQFTPATTFGQPKIGKIRISFKTSRIDVKG
jgi:hypothetical protein